MKRANHLVEKAAEPDNLRLAFWKAKKGKNYSNEVQAYRENLDANLLALRRQILTGKVKVGDYRYFMVHDPKERQICASAFGEQVLHHALMNVCHEHFERWQDFDSYASRPGKGTHAAVARAQSFSRSHEWFLKLDVRKFFASVHHETLKAQLKQLYKDKTLLGIFDQIIDSYEAQPGRGLPIGNLSSQYFANHYLVGLDHFIREELRCKAFVRYMDDLVLWHHEKAWLKDARRAIREFVENQLKCDLKPELLNSTRRGLPFLGYLLFPHHVRLSQRSKRRFAKKMVFIDKKYHSGAWSEAECQRRALSLVAFTQEADAGAFRRQVILN